MTAFVVRGQIAPAAPLAQRAPDVPEMIANWEDLLDGGWTLGPADARVTILEFGDFECPACSWFSKGALSGVLANYPEDVRFVYRHWALPYHRFAMPAAIASECAGEQGRFFEFSDRVYASPESLGVRTFTNVAATVGVPDTVAFNACVAVGSSRQRIEDGGKDAMSFSARGTPAILVNGLYLGTAPDSMTLDSIVRAQVQR